MKSVKTYRGFAYIEAKTGYSVPKKTCPEYTIAILDEEMLNYCKEEFQDLDDLLKELNVDFICIERKSEIHALHVTAFEKLELILKEGLKPNQEYFIGDLGFGVYAVLRNSNDGISNLINYITDDDVYTENDDVILIEIHGRYKYLECVYGEGHVGYICILEKIKDTDIYPKLIQIKNLERYYI